MRKSLYSFIYVFSLLSAGLSIHQAFAQRSPSVEPITEVSIEENRPTHNPGTTEPGFDFTDKNAAAVAIAPTEVAPRTTTRVPANIATKPGSAPYSYIGPLIFLFALPIALWIVIAKKMKPDESAKKVDYYAKTFQFKPYRTDYQEQDADDDQDYPKAS